MRNVYFIFLLMLLVVACNKEVPNTATVPAPSSEPESQSEPEPDRSGEKHDSLVNILLTDDLWNNLSICSHPWVNEANYDHTASKWIIHEDNPLQAEFSFASNSRNSGTMTTGQDNKKLWFYIPEYSTFEVDSGHESFAISVIGRDFFVLCMSHLSMIFSYNESVDTSRITVLDTTDQMEDPDFIWPFDEGEGNVEDKDQDEEE